MFSPTLTMSWSTWPLLKRTVLTHTVLRRSERHQRDPQVLSHRGIIWCRTLHPDHREMPQRAGLFLDRLSSKEDSDLQYLSSSSSSSLAKGQMPHNSIMGMVIIDASIAAVLLTSPRIVRGPEGIIQGKTPTKTTTKARARGKWCKSGKGELSSLLLQTFQKEHQLCRYFHYPQ